MLLATVLLVANATTAIAVRLAIAAPAASGSLVALIGLHAALLAYVAAHERSRFRTWIAPSGRGFLLGIGGGLAMLACGAAYTQALEHFGVAVPDMAAELARLVPYRAVLLAWGVLLVPLAEEAYFRGRLLDAVERRAGPIWALAASAVSFALIHAIPVLTPAYLAFAVILWWLRRRTGSLVAPIVAHALNNVVGLV